MKFLLKHFAENGKEELSLKDSSILSNLKKSQNEYYPDNLNLISFFSLISLQLLLFPVFLLKSNLLLYRKWKTFEGKNWPFFMTSKKYRFIFLVTHLLFIFVDKEIFFQEYTEMKLKTFFIIFEKDGNSHL